MPQNGEPREPGESRNNRLSSWKEIADYLDCNKRTCIRWEKHLGLPVHRLEGSIKSRVFAFRDEIDQWQREKSTLFNNNAGGGRTGGKKDGSGRPKGTRLDHTVGGKRKNVAVFVAAAVLLIGAAGYFAVKSFLMPGVPADFRIDRNDLVILNEKGNELWRHHTGIQNLVGEKYYREHFQVRRQSESGHHLPLLILEDINKDGQVETLFATATDDGSPNTRTGEIICLDHRGDRLWEFETGKALLIGSTNFSGDFYVDGLDVSDLDNDGKMEVIVSAHQWGRYPTCLCVISAEGKLLGQFWNSGQLLDIVCVDLDGDGRKEILAGGTNNEYEQGALVVFDSADVRGCSPQLKEKFTWKDMEPGSELYYVRIPRSDAELVDYYPLDNISRIFFSKKSREFSLWSQRSTLEYVFDFDMKIREVRTSHAFMIMHEKAKSAGKITSILDAAYFENLRQAVLYWDGERWVKTPAMNNRRAR